jgi:hypothetical protein
MWLVSRSNMVCLAANRTQDLCQRILRGQNANSRFERTLVGPAGYNLNHPTGAWLRSFAEQTRLVTSAARNGVGPAGIEPAAWVTAPSEDVAHGQSGRASRCNGDLFVCRRGPG